MHGVIQEEIASKIEADPASRQSEYFPVMAKIFSGQKIFLQITLFFFFNDTATTEIYTLSLHDALPISSSSWLSWFTTRSATKSSSSNTSTNRFGVQPSGCTDRGQAKA